ncbi:hypothetical protein V1525DRAFT_178692 [Lipomyces kononenkoae]|uniref:Uncharacterized protein n=1 Tax=Lipomyces kononenkoae TaxID=34357 RepID=A0ACC3TAJ9_LIPKO
MLYTIAHPQSVGIIQREIPYSQVVTTSSAVASTSSSSESILAESKSKLTHIVSTAQEHSAAERSPHLAPVLSRFRPLAPAPPAGVLQTPHLRMSGSSTSQTIPYFSTVSSSASPAAGSDASRTSSLSRAHTTADEPVDEEDWEDLPATAIREMDQTTAQHQLFRANAAIRRLRSALSIARRASSRYRFETRALKFESEESLKRYQVENFIVKRQVDILRVDLLRLRPPDSLESEMGMASTVAADKYRRRLIRAKSRLFETQQMMEEKQMEINDLKQRMREDRLNRQSRKRDSIRSGLARGDQNQDIKRRAGTNDDGGALAALGILASQVLGQQQVENPKPRTSGSRIKRPRSVHGEQGSEASATSTAQRKRVARQESMITQIAEDTDVADTDVEHMDTDPEDQFEGLKRAQTRGHSRRTSMDTEDNASASNAATEPIVDNGDTITVGYFGRQSDLANGSEIDNFDPDETIEVSSSPVTVGRFRSINNSSYHSANRRKSHQP